MKPFSLEFNAACVAMAARVNPGGFLVSGIDTALAAPTSLAELRACEKATGCIVVDSANSYATIFADAEVNYAFRAWHDWTHLRYSAEFNLCGETLVAEMQIRDLAKVYGASFAERYKPLIYAEVIGQALYKELTGAFPVEQRAFDKTFLASLGDYWHVEDYMSPTANLHTIRDEPTPHVPQRGHEVFRAMALGENAAHHAIRGNRGDMRLHGVRDTGWPHGDTAKLAQELVSSTRDYHLVAWAAKALLHTRATGLPLGNLPHSEAEVQEAITRLEYRHGKPAPSTDEGVKIRSKAV
jgi:hypothetical protein